MREKKDLGDWGERKLDVWIESLEWKKIASNLKISGGEIDRIYFSKFGKNICVCEVKTIRISKISQFSLLFQETGARSFLKSRQMRNIYLQCERMKVQKAYQRCHFLPRIFIVLQMKVSIYNKIMDFALMTGKFYEKVVPRLCAHFSNQDGESGFILSLIPEFTTIKERRSLVQIFI